MVNKIKYYYNVFEQEVVSLYTSCFDSVTKVSSYVIDRFGIKKILIFITIIAIFASSAVVFANIYISKMNAKYMMKYIEIDRDIDNFCSSDFHSIRKDIISLPSYITYNIISICVDKLRGDLVKNSDKIVKLMNLNISSSIDKVTINIAKLQKFVFLVELGGVTKKDIAMVEGIVKDKYLGSLASEILMKYDLYNGNMDGYKKSIDDYVKKNNVTQPNSRSAARIIELKRSLQ